MELDPGCVTHGRERTVKAKNRRTGFTFPHDFFLAEDGTVDQQAPAAKYERRIARVYEKCREKSCLGIFGVWDENPLNNALLLRRVLEGLTRVREATGAQRFDLLLLTAADAPGLKQDEMACFAAAGSRVFVVEIRPR